MTHLSTLIVSLVQSYGYAAVFLLMMLESILIPIPSEVTMPFAGFLVSRGTLQFSPVVLVGTLGNLVGSLLCYYLGYELGEHTLLHLIRRYGKYVWLKESDYARSARWFETYGSGAILTSRLLPAVRTFISLPAGMFEMSIWKFSLYTFVGSLLWSAVLTYIGLYLGDKWSTIGPAFSNLLYILAAVATVFVGYFVYHRVHRKQKQSSD